MKRALQRTIINRKSYAKSNGSKKSGKMTSSATVSNSMNESVMTTFKNKLICTNYKLHKMYVNFF